MAASNGGFPEVDLCNGFTEIDLRSGFRTVGIVTVIGAIQNPFQHLLPPVAGRDLRCQHAFVDAAQR